ncbi:MULTISPECIES: hypothetical protein [unclassified Frankia]|uniref:hypothetical protein n=1 Tax=unclassified Frankia TaxID=2632575 RepID=UPI002AD2EC5D|nr:MULTISPECIES: hypothetical protein [unclassified Frankia]
MLLLLQEDPLTVGCLAGRLGLTLATASGIVAELERASFVKAMDLLEAELATTSKE